MAEEKGSDKHRLRASKKKLEEIVNEKTAEVVAQKNEIATQRDQIANQKVICILSFFPFP